MNLQPFHFMGCCTNKDNPRVDNPRVVEHAQANPNVEEHPREVVYEDLDPTLMVLKRQAIGSTTRTIYLGLLDQERNERYGMGIVDEGSSNTREGSFNKDKITGIGRISTLQEGKRIIYEGQLYTDKKTGFGVEIEYRVSTREDKKYTKISTYRGYWDNNTKDGFGVLERHDSGIIYRGYFLNNKYSGWGEYRAENNGQVVVLRGKFAEGAKVDLFIKDTYRQHQLDLKQYLEFKSDATKPDSLIITKKMGQQPPVGYTCEKYHQDCRVDDEKRPEEIENMIRDNYKTIEDHTAFDTTMLIFKDDFGYKVDDGHLFSKSKIKLKMELREKKQGRPKPNKYYGKGYFCNSRDMAYYSFYEYYISRLLLKRNTRSKLYLKNTDHKFYSIDNNYYKGYIVGSNICTDITKLNAENQVLSLLETTFLPTEHNLENLINSVKNPKKVTLFNNFYTKLTLENAVVISYLLLKGLKELEDFGVFHGYIRPKNIYIYVWKSGEYAVKLVNYAHTHYMEGTKMHNRNTLFSPVGTKNDQINENILHNHQRLEVIPTLSEEIVNMSEKSNNKIFESQIYPFEYREEENKYIYYLTPEVRKVVSGNLDSVGYITPLGENRRPAHPNQPNPKYAPTVTSHNVVESDMFAAAVVILELLLSVGERVDLLHRLSDPQCNSGEYIKIIEEMKGSGICHEGVLDVIKGIILGGKYTSFRGVFEGVCGVQGVDQGWGGRVRDLEGGDIGEGDSSDVVSLDDMGDKMYQGIWGLIEETMQLFPCNKDEELHLGDTIHN